MIIAHNMPAAGVSSIPLGLAKSNNGANIIQYGTPEIYARMGVQKGSRQIPIAYQASIQVIAMAMTIITPKMIVRMARLFILYFYAERQRSPAAHFVRRTVQRLVRIYVLAARLFHFLLRIVFSSAESGRISGQADLIIF